jgi:DNA-binding NarL/FixJ family response regulator
MDRDFSVASAGSSTEYAAPRAYPGSASALDQIPAGTGFHFGALFDEFSFGVAIVGVAGNLLHASRAALMQLQACRGLRLAGGLVEAVSPVDAVALRQALSGAVAGRRSYLVLGAPAARLDVAFLPVSSNGCISPPAATLVFEKCTGSSGLGLYFFAQAYGLTRTEQFVLSELCEGISVVEVAQRKGSAVHTVRTHVRNILMKTNEANLRSLVRRVGLMPPIGARFAAAHARNEALGRREAGPAPSCMTPGAVSADVAVAVRAAVM